MITLLLILLVIFSIMDSSADAKDWEASEYNAEMRHQELMREQRRTRATIRRAAKFNGRRRSLTDQYGNVLVEEIITSGDEDDYDDNEFEEEFTDE